MAPLKTALIVIDVQNDYFAEGKFPLWNIELALANTEAAIFQAQALGMPVVLVQHVASSAASPLFVAGSSGVAIHPRIQALAPDAPVVVKAHADSFFGTTLEATLAALGVEALLICGMMTQNCVTHTAIARAADKYAVTVLSDCCTTVSEMIHKFALNALSTRVSIAPFALAMAA